MSQWFRVFGTNDVQPTPAALLEALRGLGVEARGNFRGDDLGWFQADLRYDDGPPLRLDRYLAKEDGIRPDLSTWAAWLESVGDSETHHRLMRHVITTSQLFTMHQPLEDGEEPGIDPEADRLAIGLCQCLARETAGVYQVDHRGFFAADGTLLIPEEEHMGA